MEIPFMVVEAERTSPQTTVLFAAVYTGISPLFSVSVDIYLNRVR